MEKLPKIICPIHAKERMEQRGISREQVVKTIINPEITMPCIQKNRRRVMKKFGSKTLDVIYEPKEKEKIVLITAVWLADEDRKVKEKKV
jgi:hypothetical protein